MDQKNKITYKIYTKNGLTKENVYNDKKILHLGCGKNKLPGAIGIDRLKISEVDIVHNLDITPWPINDNKFDIVIVHSLLEHVNDIVNFFNELWRVARSGARVVITVPYFRCIDSFTDPTHKHFFTSKSLDYFIKEARLANYEYGSGDFRKVGFWYGYPWSKNLFAKLFKHYISKHPKFYDQYLSSILPVKILVWELEVIK